MYHNPDDRERETVAGTSMCRLFFRPLLPIHRGGRGRIDVSALLRMYLRTCVVLASSGVEKPILPPSSTK
jgi:hypothetical protein